MGISQCLRVVPPFIAFGFSLILQQDYLGIANIWHSDKQTFVLEKAAITTYGNSTSTLTFQHTTSYIQIVLPLLSFGIYIFVIGYLLKIKLNIGQHNFLEEKSIFAFAFTRTLFDVTSACLFHYANFSY
ncbi:hypothetical protein L596_019469 [Steinernema carpocapsae]|uniref:Uncharacterized protein n=1 Tax=Steinernema carpocapsae TaxID=34508 RepID=A0A4U5MQP6_STECR|nr:hypothetical protein L596_019469 [Steinernema carpocapsae]